MNSKEPKKDAASKEVTIACVFGLIAFIVNAAGIVIPDKTFYLFSSVGAMAGSALAKIAFDHLKDNAKWLTILVGVNVISFFAAAIYYFKNIQVGSANWIDVAELAVAFAIMFFSCVFVMRMAGINPWANLPKGDGASS